MRHSLVLSEVEPVRIITGGEVATGPGAMLWIVAGAVLLIAFVLAGLGLWRRSQTRRDDREHAFRRVSGALGVPRGMARAVRIAAGAHGAASPVGLLLSNDGLRAALARIETDVLSASDRKLVEQLRRELNLAAT